MLWFVYDMPSKDISVLAMVLTVFQMNITEFHSRINARWYILQKIMERTLDVVFSSCALLETVYSIISSLVPTRYP